MILEYNSNKSNNFWACKPSIHSYSTVYRSGEKTGGPRGAPLEMPPKDRYIEISSSKALFFKHSKAGGLGVETPIK